MHFLVLCYLAVVSSIPSYSWLINFSTVMPGWPVSESLLKDSVLEYHIIVITFLNDRHVQFPNQRYFIIIIILIIFMYLNFYTCTSNCGGLNSYTDPINYF